MINPSPLYWKLFFELYESLPRQGPGNLASARRALSLCRGLPEHPVILDLGCGSGAQTLHLAELTGGRITAVESHAPFIARLESAVAALGLSDRVHPLVGDMARPPAAPGTVDLIWSEGAAYFLGIERALNLWRPLLRPGGHLAFTEAVWLQPCPPPEAREFWAREYPAIRETPATLALLAGCGYRVEGHFTLPPEAWWTDFYGPMEARIAEMRGRHAGDASAAVLDSLEAEITGHRRHSSWYGYEFFVATA